MNTQALYIQHARLQASRHQDALNTVRNATSPRTKAIYLAIAAGHRAGVNMMKRQAVLAA
jgi:hypothetical protein